MTDTFHFSFSFAHHGRYSSYHRFLHYVEAPDAAFDSTNRLVNRIPSSMNRRILTAWRQYSEKAAWKKANELEAKTFHYLYPENTCFKPEVFRGRKKILLSCHQPRRVVEGRIESGKFGNMSKALAAADGVVVLGPDEVAIYQELAPQAVVKFIPHGIDSEWFCPPDKPLDSLRRRGSRRVLTAGNWLRDYRFWAEVVNRAAEDRAGIEFIILANRETIDGALAELSDGARKLVVPHCGISDEHLRELYWTVDLVFLPLLDATANNVVLEALACQRALLVNDMTATKAYANDGACYFSSDGVDDAYGKLLNLLEDQGARETLAKAGRRRVEGHLAWPKVIERHQAMSTHLSAL